MSHFLPKKDMMLPCDALPEFCLGLAFADEAENEGLGVITAGSSSEKDSQAASSLVTVHM
jgi:hypothetical protein